MSQPFPSMKAKDLLAVLMKEPLNYYVHRQEGSHRHLRADGRDRILFSWHDGDSLPRGLVRKTLVKDAGLSVDEALQLVGG